MEKLAVIELTEVGTRLTIANESNGKYKNKRQGQRLLPCGA